MGADESVLVAGGGPVGLACAYNLARKGIPVTVFDENPELQNDPRAATLHPATLELLDELGIIDQVIRQGLISREFQFWDRPSNALIAEFDHSLLGDDTKYPYVVQCEQFKVTRILLDLLSSLSHCKVYFSHEVCSVQQSEDSVSLEVETPDGRERFAGSYILGCDGGRSQVRKNSSIEFKGFTWPERFLVLSTPFDFEKNRGMCFRNYVADPDEWCNCFKVAGDGPPGLWRVVFPADPEASEDHLLSDQFVQEKLQSFFPLDQDYDVVHRNLYNVHQRVAVTFRDRRVLLAGDSCHINNSIGGMGLNGGLQDAMSLTDKLALHMEGKEDDSILDLYDLQRRTFAVEFVQEQTIQNKKRLETRDAESRALMLNNLKETANDPVRARNFLLKTSMIEALRRSEKLMLNGET